MTKAPGPGDRALISAKQDTASQLRLLTARLVQETGRRVTVNEALAALIREADVDRLVQVLKQEGLSQ